MTEKIRNLGKCRPIVRTVLWLGFLIALILVIFRGLAFGSRIPFWMDPVTAFYPYSHYLVTSLKSGIVPLWNPFIFSGYPFIADTQAAVMYPINWILSFMLSPERFLGVKIVLHFVLAGVFTFLFLMRLKCSRPSAFLGAVAFTLSGALVPKTALPSIHQTAALIPLCFFSFSFLCDDLSLRRAVFCGFVIGLLLLSGYMQIAHFTVITLLIYLLLKACNVRVNHGNTTRRKLLVGNAMYWLGGLFLAASLVIVITPDVVWVVGPLRISIRHATNPIHIGIFLLTCGWLLRGNRVKLSFKKFGRCVMLWISTIFGGFCIAASQLLPCMQFARFSGQQLSRTPNEIGSLEAGALLKDLLIASATNFEWQASVGTLPILLFIAVIILQRKKVFSIPGFTAVSGVLVFSILVVTGYPLIVALLSFVPGFLLFHHLGRNVSLIAFPMAVLGAISANYVFCRMSKTLRTIAYGAVIAITTLQLLHYNHSPLRTVNPGEYAGCPASISFLKKNCKGWRAFGFDKNYSYHYDREGGITKLLIPNTAMLYGIRDVQGYSPLQFKRYKEYLKVMSDGRKNFYPYEDTYHMALIGQGHSSLLDILGVKYVLSEYPVLTQGFALAQNEGVKVYENQSAFPQALIFRRFLVLPDGIETAQLIHDAKVDPRETVILSKKDLKYCRELSEFAIPLDKRVCGMPIYEFKCEESQLTWPDKAIVEEFRPSYLKILCDVQGTGGILFVNEILYPGWKARINGRLTPLIRANYLFRAVIIPAGTHIVEMEFKPRLYYIGLIVSALWLFILVLILVLDYVKQFHNRSIGYTK